MTAKRFEINNNMSPDDKVETYELSCIIDNDNKTFYFVVDSIANVESFVERLNELHEENTMLKERRHEDINDLSVIAMRYKALEKENEELKQLLDYAEDLIQSHLSEHFIRQWRNFKTGHKEYNDFWEEKLKKHKV